MVNCDFCHIVNGVCWSAENCYLWWFEDFGVLRDEEFSVFRRFHKYFGDILYQKKLILVQNVNNWVKHYTSISLLWIHRCNHDWVIQLVEIKLRQVNWCKKCWTTTVFCQIWSNDRNLVYVTKVTVHHEFFEF